MSSLREDLQEYLTLRRSLGYKMQDAGRLLPRFVAYLEERGAHITTRLALEWAQQAGATCRVGSRLGLRPRLRSLLQRYGCTHRDSAGAAAAASIDPGQAIPVLGR